MTISDTKFLWCGSTICEARDAGGAVQKRFFTQGVQDGGTAFFYTRDHLGSVRELTDQTGAVRGYGLYGTLRACPEQPDVRALSRLRRQSRSVDLRRSDGPLGRCEPVRICRRESDVYVDPLGRQRTVFGGGLDSVTKTIEQALAKGNIEEAKAFARQYMQRSARAHVYMRDILGDEYDRIMKAVFDEPFPHW